MIEILRGLPFEMLQVAFFVLTVLVIVTMFITVSYHRLRARLPLATRLDHLGELVARREAERSELEETLQSLRQKASERDHLIAELSALEERRDAVRMELEQQDDAIREIDETKRQAAEAAADYAEKVTQRDELVQELAQLKDAIDKARQQLERKPEDLERRISELEERIADLNDERRRIQDDLAPLRAEKDALLAAKDEAAALSARRAVLEQEVENLAGRSKELREEVGKAEEVAAALRNARAEKAALDDEAQQLRARIEKLRAELGGISAGGAEEGKDDVVADLRRQPACLVNPSVLRQTRKPEVEAVHDVTTYLERLGLRYPDRTIFAFHTALKINDVAQLTVLSGVSGTGKSLLPRCYAEAMGMHFLQIAVEPRWDSPQDLLGFYNYIEKRYRATDLARALVYMDPYATSRLADSDFKDHMLLVLLDEMNLARIEYYFSEFLSRLESRPRYEQVDDPKRRGAAEIGIDIRGHEKGGISLFPSHNVLFTGTMNDDESTQALSDKVLDRGNVLQFPAPQDFVTAEPAGGIAAPVEGQSFSQWRNWVLPTASLEGARREKARRVIVRLAKIMESAGRPFGHRLYDAMLAYVANYPVEGPGGDGVEAPLADQIEFRIMPKLRGIEIETHENTLRELAALLRDELGDRPFADRLQSLIEQDAAEGGLFVWRGLDREGA